MAIEMKPIGFVRHEFEKVPRHWSVSDMEGELIINEEYVEGIEDIKAGQHIVLIFHFHKSPEFTSRYLKQSPPNRKEIMGVFSCCSPRRPNPIGMSVLKVLKIKGGVIYVKGIDMYNKTPILDIKPYVTDKHTCPIYMENEK